jgi:hypothetical protein
MSFQALASEPSASMPRQASSMTSAPACLARVHRGPGDAEVGREPDEEDLIEPAILQIAREPRRRLAVGLVERGVRIHLLAIALADDQLGVRDPEVLWRSAPGVPCTQ